MLKEIQNLKDRIYEILEKPRRTSYPNPQAIKNQLHELVDLPDQERAKRIDELSNTYNEIHLTIGIYRDTKSQLADIEKGQYFRQAMFRIGSTAGVAITLILIYWIAYSLDLPLPLIKDSFTANE